MLRIFTDGGADMPGEWRKEYDIQMLPLRLRFGEETFVQGEGIDLNNFYDIVKAKKMIPGTSLPSPQQVMEFYRQHAKPGDDILSIHISSKLSGTFSVVQMAAREVIKEFNVIPFDSGAGSAAQGYLCREARRLYQAGIPLRGIIERLERIRDRLTVVFTLNTLEFARMNGRVSALQDVLTSLLKIKPIIILREGLLVMGDKVRTRQRALEQVMNYVHTQLNDHLLDVFVVHAADLAAANNLVNQVRDVLKIRNLYVTDLSIPVAANLGPGTVGIVAIPISED